MDRRILVTGWFSFPHGEATAGDMLALDRVREVLHRSGLAHDVAWSPGFRPDALHLTDVRPEAYSHLVYVCGPLHGEQVGEPGEEQTEGRVEGQIEELHRRFAHCVRVAVGTSASDPASTAVTGFHRVLFRDGVGPHAEPVPVAGVVLDEGDTQDGAEGAEGADGADRRDKEGTRRLAPVAPAVTRWLHGKDCARLELDTRLDSHLDTRGRRPAATPGRLESVLKRLDLVVTDRPHGLVLALRAGVPVLAVDPVQGGAEVTAQARACGWPALVPIERLDERELERWWTWCLTSGRVSARQIACEFAQDPAGNTAEDGAENRAEELVGALVGALPNLVRGARPVPVPGD